MHLCVHRHVPLTPCMEIVGNSTMKDDYYKLGLISKMYPPTHVENILGQNV